MSEKAADNNPTKENNTTPNEVKDEWMASLTKCNLCVLFFYLTLCRSENA